MKRFLSIWLLLMMIVTTCFAADSPSLEDLYWCQPDLPFHVVELDEEWEDIYNTVSEVVDFNKLFEDDYYGIYEIIAVEVDDIYPTMTWSFPCEYKEDQIIKFVFCSMDLITIEVCNGTLNEDGSRTGGRSSKVYP